tara:strand:- start:4899 stop:6290 length:1392 start_codon:yes stop_codon:yes gene_type:complete
MSITSITKLPFIALDVDIEKDDYNKLTVGDVQVANTEILNVVSKKSYNEKVHGLNFNVAKWTPQMKDKIYFMKGCTVPRIKLKDLSVKYKIRTTTDLETATVVVGSDRAGEKLFKNTWTHTVPAKTFFATIEALKELSPDFDNYYANQIDDILEGFDRDELTHIAVDWNTARWCQPTNSNNGPLGPVILKKLGLTKDQFNASSIRTNKNDNLWTISDDNLEIYDQVKTKNIIEQNALLEVVNGDDSVLIDLDTYQNLRNMFKSSDTDNHVMAMEIMANANYLDSLLHLEMLFFHHSHQIDNSRTRNHVNFKSLKNYLGRGSYSNNHIDGVFSSLISFGKLDPAALNFIMEDQKEYFASNGYSNYIKPSAYGINPEYQPQLNYSWIHKTEAFVDETTVPEVEEEEVVEDTVEEVTVSEATQEFSAHFPPRKIEEAEVETEEEATEEVLIAEQKEEKNEEEFDWF